MKHQDFETMLLERMSKIKNTLSKKGEEYSSDDDRLYNFKRAAEIQRTTPTKALVGMLAKHLVSVLDIVDSKYSTPDSVLDEKIGDTINYLILLEAAIKDDKQKEVQ